jgi:hypothetical protein
MAILSGGGLARQAFASFLDTAKSGADDETTTGAASRRGLPI